MTVRGIDLATNPYTREYHLHSFVHPAVAYRRSLCHLELFGRVLHKRCAGRLSLALPTAPTVSLSKTLSLIEKSTRLLLQLC
jgi:hypothetical protein